jgi:hypothetical protein
MKTVVVSLFFSIALVHSLGAQDIPLLTDTLAMILPTQVQQGSDNYEQEINADPENPCRIHFRSVRTDSKGRMSAEDFYFYAEDIDLENVKVTATRRSIYVEVPMKSRQSVVEYYQDQVPQNYLRSFNILAVDADNARQIEYQLRKLPPPCEAAFEAANNYQDAGMDQLLDWMAANTVDVIEPEGTIGQSLSREDLQTGAGIVLVRTETDSKGNILTETVSVNAGDLDGEKAEMKVRGKEISIEIPVLANQRYARLEDAQGRVRYQNKISIQVNTIDEGRSMVRVLQNMTPPARTFQGEKIKGLGEPANALSKLNTISFRSEVAGTRFDVTMDGDCFSEWKVRKTPAKGDVSTEVFRVFLQDVEKAEIEVSSGSVKVELSTFDRNRYVETQSGDERGSYTNRISLPVASIEEARILAHLVEQALVACRQETLDIPGDDAAALVDYLEDQGGKVESQKGAIQQSFSRVEADESCKIRVTQKREDSRGEEMQYEFSLSDIDPESVRIYVSGSNIAVDINTKRKETLIKTIENGEPDDFVNTVRIWVKDLEGARTIAYVIQSAAVVCQE